jgi:hypothetical protein
LSPASAKPGQWRFNLSGNGDYDLVLLGQKTVVMNVQIP